MCFSKFAKATKSDENTFARSKFIIRQSQLSEILIGGFIAKCGRYIVTRGGWSMISIIDRPALLRDGGDGSSKSDRGRISLFECLTLSHEGARPMRVRPGRVGRFHSDKGCIGLALVSLKLNGASLWVDGRPVTPRALRIRGYTSRTPGVSCSCIYTCTYPNALRCPAPRSSPPCGNWVRPPELGAADRMADPPPMRSAVDASRVPVLLWFTGPDLIDHWDDKCWQKITRGIVNLILWD